MEIDLTRWLKLRLWNRYEHTSVEERGVNVHYPSASVALEGPRVEVNVLHRLGGKTNLFTLLMRGGGWGGGWRSVPWRGSQSTDGCPPAAVFRAPALPAGGLYSSDVGGHVGVI